MNIVKANRKFEHWLGKQTSLVGPDLSFKHHQMAQAPFSFLRGTFYRWAQLWPKVCSKLAKAPAVLAVGDLHAESFGTWRDIEGRLVWGVNDFDDAAVLPYTSDLVRLATSLLFAVEDTRIKARAEDVCEKILEGYAASLEAGGRPIMLGVNNDTWLLQITEIQLRDHKVFWEKINRLPSVKGEIPASVTKALAHLLPPSVGYRLARRVAGLGSLGHPRYVAVADWRGGMIAREAKAVVTSSCYWALKHSENPPEHPYETIVARAVRSPDPLLQLRGKWLVRRLAPDCLRLEIHNLPTGDGTLRCLFAMGWETANIHLGTAHLRKQVLRHLRGLKGKWLYAAAAEMSESLKDDYQQWSDLFKSKDRDPNQN